MTNKELSIILRLKDEASKRLRGLQGTLYKFQNSFKKNWLAVTAAVTGAFFLIKKAFDQIALGARIEQQSRAFDDLAHSYSVNSKKILQDMREASQGALTTMELMHKASKAMTLGLNPDKFRELMEISRASARAMGEDIDFMFDSIVTGIGRQSKLILDNLGIIVSASDAYEKYAFKMGKTVGQLTDAEKKQAFFNAVLEQGKDITSKINTSYRSNAENLQIISASLVEAKNEVLLFITQSNDLTQVADKFRELASSLAYFRKGLLLTKMENLKEDIKSLVAPTNFFTKAVNRFFDSVGSRNRTKLEELQKELAQTVIAMKKMDIYVDDSILNFLNREGRTKVQKTVKEMTDALNRERPKVDQVLAEWEKKWQTYFEGLPETQLENLEKMKEQYIEHGADLAKVDRWYEAQKQQIGRRMLKDAEKNFDAMRDLAEDTFTNMKNAFSDIFYDAFKNKMKNAKDILASFGDAMLRSISNTMAGSLMQSLGLKTGINSFFGVPSFHEGGMVHPVRLKAHNGLYIGRRQADEVPILAQTGERILNRKETQEYNAGSQTGTLPAPIHIQVVTVDGRMVREETVNVIGSDQNRRFVINAVADDFANNGVMRKAIKNG